MNDEQMVFNCIDAAQETEDHTEPADRFLATLAISTRITLNAHPLSSCRHTTAIQLASEKARATGSYLDLFGCTKTPSTWSLVMLFTREQMNK